MLSHRSQEEPADGPPRRCRHRRFTGRARSASFTAFIAWLGLAAAGAWCQTLPPALAAGDLLVVDANNDRILFVRPSTGYATPFSPPSGAYPPPIGSFEAILEDPVAIVATDQGHIYVVDSGLDALVEIDPATGAQSLLLAPDGSPIRVHRGLAVDARGVLYAWDLYDGVVRVEPTTGYRWRRIVVSDFERPSDFRVGGITLTRDADGLASDVFLPVTIYTDPEPSALWRVDAQSGAAAPIPATQDADAIYLGAVARGDCKALSCSVVYARCQRNAGIFGNMPSLEAFGVVGLIPLFGTVFDGFETNRCAFALTQGSTVDENFVATGFGYEDGRIERVSGSPAATEISAVLPRGPFDYAPFPVSLTRVIRPDAIDVPEPECGSAVAAALAGLVALAWRRVRRA